MRHPNEGPNEALRAARESVPSPYVPDDACMSRAELAEAVNRWCAENGRRPGALDEHRIDRMEQGKTLWPNADYRAGFRAVLGRTDRELGFRPSGRSPVRPAGISFESAGRPVTFESGGKPSAREIAASQQEWLRVRQAPGVRGRELTELAAWLYPESHRAPGGHVLAAPGWLLDKPVALESVELEWATDQPPTPKWPQLDHVLPLTTHGERYAGYSRAVRDPAIVRDPCRRPQRLLAVAQHHARVLRRVPRQRGRQGRPNQHAVHRGNDRPPRHPPVRERTNPAAPRLA